MPTRKLQNPEDFGGQKFYIGIDVHKKSWAVTVRSLNFVVVIDFRGSKIRLFRGHNRFLPETQDFERLPWRYIAGIPCCSNFLAAQ